MVENCVKMPYDVSTTAFGVIVITPLKQIELCRPLNKSGAGVFNLTTVKGILLLDLV